MNVGTSKHAGGDRVSTISLLGCGTSVALATGPTDEEEEEEEEEEICNVNKHTIYFDEVHAPCFQEKHSTLIHGQP